VDEARVVVHYQDVVDRTPETLEDLAQLAPTDRLHEATVDAQHLGHPIAEWERESDERDW
jgi:hypothetical protein